MKKITSIFLALAMLLTLSPMNAFAAEGGDADQDNSLELSVDSVNNEIRSDALEGDADWQEVSLMSDSSGATSSNDDMSLSEETSSNDDVVLSDETSKDDAISFSREYYNSAFYEQSMLIKMTASLAKEITEKIPDYTQYENYTLSMDFKNSEGSVVQSLSDIPISSIRISSTRGEISSGSISCNIYLVNLENDSYSVTVNINDAEGKAYELGKADLNITDKAIAIIDYLEIPNYDYELTTATSSFYVTLGMNGIFLDCDKIDINLWNEENNKIVAKTVSKEVKNIDEYEYSSELLYKLQVIEPLEADKNYKLEIQAKSDMVLAPQNISDYVEVTDQAKVISVEFIGTNTVRFRTENLSPGEYVVEDYDSKDTYIITIDEQGIGSFEITDMADYEEDSYHGLSLKNSDGEVIDSSLDIPSSGTTSDAGYIEVNNACYDWVTIGDTATRYAVGDKKISFTAYDIDSTTGTVSLYKYPSSDDDEEDPVLLEKLDLADLEKTTENSYYTYKGSFTTELEEGIAYRVVLEGNGDKKEYYTCHYCPDKLADLQLDNSIAYNGECVITLYEQVNISDVKNLKFQAVSGSDYLEVKDYYVGEDYVEFNLDISSLPTGYFTINVFDGSEPVTLLSEQATAYNLGNVEEPITDYTFEGYDKDDKAIIGVDGANLDKLSSALVKIYKKVDFPEGDSYSYDYDKYKLQHVKDVSLQAPYKKTELSLRMDTIGGLEKGDYVFVFVLDGTAVEATEISYDPLSRDVFVKVNNNNYYYALTSNSSTKGIILAAYYDENGRFISFESFEETTKNISVFSPENAKTAKLMWLSSLTEPEPISKAIKINL